MTTAPCVLIVDADVVVRARLAELLDREGVASLHVDSVAAAVDALERRPFAFVVADLALPGVAGPGLIVKVSAGFPGTPIVVTATSPSAPETEEALRDGALDVLAKPFEPDEVAHVAQKALGVASRKESELAAPASVTPIVGRSRAMQDVQALIQRAAQGRATVLIRGESGTGKDLAARSLHELGPRKGRPFVKIDCTALPDALLESELFGHEKGAFTGATRVKPGRVELADGGTLFLDEIGELPGPLQAKLLRLIQDQEFEHLGGTATIRVDVRVVAATHRDLEQMIEARTFREDLFYRLNVVPIWMPPLRARRDDIEPLVARFCEVFALANGRPLPQIEPGALRLLRRERWAGNVRQLQNIIERLIVLGEDSVLREDDLRAELAQKPGGFATEPLTTAPRAAASDTSAEGSLESGMLAAERQLIVRALARANGNRSLAARVLQVSRSTLYAKLEAHGLG